MKLGLISDTHDNLPLVKSAARFFRERAPDRIFHLGDVMSPAVLEELWKVGVPLTVVLGNNDSRRELPQATMDWEGLLEGARVYAHHGHTRASPAHEPDLLLHGHTHQRRVQRIGRTLVVNPGALHRATTRTIAMVDVPTLAVHYYEVRDDKVVALH